MNPTRVNMVVWFGVLGGPMAWLVQHVASIGFSWAQCDQPVTRWELPVHGWQIALGAGAALIGLASEGVALHVFLRTREIGEGTSRRGIGEAEGTTARIHFLAIVGLTVNFLALAIIVMDAIGAPLLQLCRQS